MVDVNDLETLVVRHGGDIDLSANANGEIWIDQGRTMKEKDYDAIIENEREWRRYVVVKLDKLETEHNSFKIRAIGFMSTMSFVINIAMKYFGVGK